MFIIWLKRSISKRAGVMRAWLAVYTRLGRRKSANAIDDRIFLKNMLTDKNLRAADRDEPEEEACTALKERQARRWRQCEELKSEKLPSSGFS
ncbi:hypothetical protein T02_15479 [Trichinella nativa]|uniref:Uncharacterized protein n=1 Tax=Trichinella nativa TaxID=6335 RepID=A0A0V1LN44_9BILA|nr:hypothetical protein T02_15479 [Trichinella nativa]